MAINTHVIISLAHLLFIVPGLLYVGFMRAANPLWVYWFLGGIGIVLALFHGMKAIAKWFAGSPSFWVNAIHALLLAPLFIYIAVYRRETPRAAYELVLLAAFAALGYHIYNLAINLEVRDD
jgi:hypothetical protein